MSYTNGLDKPTDYFNTVLYSGNATARSITGVGFQPDWVWIKGRTTAYNNTLFDAIRGATKRLYSNGTDAESTQSVTLTSFDSDGFSLGNNASVNSATSTFVAWNWLASNTTASNTDGSITSTVSVNTTSGFSIVSYTGNGTAGATVGHGLGVAPKMIIAKVRSTTEDWPVYHASLGATKYVKLSSTGASETETSIFNDTEPTSSVFSLGTQNKINMNTQTFIAYCFAEKKGFSKFGSYTGNGSTDGTFVYTGFRVGWVMIKRTSGTDGWVIYDNKRETFNVHNLILDANTSNPEEDVSAYNTLDILSNGFKCRGGSSGSGTATNQSGGSYIYMAFAENPFVTSTGIPTTAR